MSEPIKPLNCPAAGEQCCYLDEIKSLRQQVEELKELVLKDELTGLFNYRHFIYALQAEMDRSKRSGIPTSLVLIDLDHFNKINEAYGHESGNTVLKQVAETLSAEVRTTDIVCRYGGEEFAIIFPETHLNLAIKVADRIREIIAFTPIETANGAIDVTASMGASVYLKASILPLDEFVNSVGKYLSEAKQSGRNCICHIDYADLSTVTEIGFDVRAMLLDAE